MKAYRQLKNDLNRRALKANPKAHRITLRELDSVWSYYGGKCCKCSEANPKLVSFDHVNPLELGGPNTIENLQLLCLSDNKSKGAAFADYRPKDKPILRHVEKQKRQKRGVSTTYGVGAYCQAKTKSGKSCGGFAIEGDRYCFTHSPSRVRERAQAHKRGGASRPRPTNDTPFPEADVKTANGLLLMMEGVLKDTWALESSVARSRTLGYLSQVQRGILEVGELEERVNRLEEIANHGQLGKEN